MWALILIAIFTVINLVLYHKVFDVYYFGGQAMVKELVTAIFIAIIESALVVSFGGYILIIIGIIIVIVLIVKAVKKHTESSGNVDSINKENKSTVNVQSEKKAPIKENVTEVKKPTPVKPKENITPVKKEEKKAEKPVTKTEPTSSNTNKSDKMFCPYCGEKILRTAKFCNYCGKSNSYNK